MSLVLLGCIDTDAQPDTPMLLVTQNETSVAQQTLSGASILESRSSSSVAFRLVQ